MLIVLSILMLTVVFKGQFRLQIKVYVIHLIITSKIFDKDQIVKGIGFANYH